MKSEKMQNLEMVCSAHARRCMLCALLFLLLLFIRLAGIKTPAKTVIYSADASKYSEEPPKQWTAKDVRQPGLGVWKEVYSPCREKATSNYTYVPKYNHTDSSRLIAYVDEGGTNGTWNKAQKLFVDREKEKPYQH